MWRLGDSAHLHNRTWHNLSAKQSIELKTKEKIHVILPILYSSFHPPYSCIIHCICSLVYQKMKQLYKFYKHLDIVLLGIFNKWNSSCRFHQKPLSVSSAKSSSKKGAVYFTEHSTLSKSRMLTKRCRAWEKISKTLAKIQETKYCNFLYN